MKEFKKLCLICTFLLLSSTSTVVFSAFTRTLLVLDMLNVPKLPKNFRTTNTHPHNQSLDWRGMSTLRIAGGGEFSGLALKQILKTLNTTALTIIDLRQESHGCLDGSAVSWYAPHDAVNAGKLPNEIEISQAKQLSSIKQFHNVNVNEILQKTPDDLIEKVRPIRFEVHSVASEEEVVKRLHLHYHRIYVEDFHAPTPDQVDRFLSIVKQLPNNEWIYFHCRAGVGRTTTFMAMYDMLHNAKNVSYDNILARQADIGGKDVNELPEPNRWKYRFAVERLAFLKAFYEYARDNNDNYQTTWSQWLSKHES